MIVLSHPIGNNFVRAVLAGLSQSGRLDSFHTSIAIDPENPLLKLLPEGISKEVLRRSYPVESGKIITYPFLEVLRILSPKLKARFLTEHETGIASVDSIFQSQDAEVARYLQRRSQDLQKSPLTGIYAYEDGALDSFLAARELGLKCIYDLPIAYYQTSQELLAQEAERYPEWEPTLFATRDSQKKLERKASEIELADMIVCPSRFVVESIPEQIKRKSKVVLAEFGSPHMERLEKSYVRKDKLKILFAGALSQRKGLADLFQAIKLLNSNRVELVLLGSPILSMDFYRKQYSDFTYEAVRPNREVLELMKSCDLFVFPSIVEGRAQVQQEAMSVGLPVIATKNAGADDLIEDGQSGFIVPIRDSQTLAEKINYFIENPDKLEEMGKYAYLKAQRLSWTSYQEKILNAMDEFMAGKF